MKKINYIAPIGLTGYGVAAANILKALDAQGYDFTLWPVSQPQIDNEIYIPSVRKGINNQATFDPTAPSVRIWHQFDMGQRVGRGPLVGFPFFELTQFTDAEKHHMGHVDHAIVSSEWAKDIMAREVPGVETDVVPLGVDTTLFNQNAAQVSADKFIVLNVGKLEVRKGHDVLPEIFNRAFTKRDQVELWLIVDNLFYNEQQNTEWHNLYTQTALADKIKFIPRLRTHSDVAKVMATSSMGIFPARAEGWNLELLEMMAMGKPVIATDYSAHTEFCNADNCKLIDIDGLESAYDGVWFHGFGEWAEINEKQIDQAVVHLRDLHRQWKQNPMEFINHAGLETGQKFSWNHSADKLVEVMEKL